MNGNGLVELRLTCNVVGPRNDHGREKLVASLVPEGLWCWCKYCQKPYYIAQETYAAFLRGETATKGCGHV